MFDTRFVSHHDAKRSMSSLPIFPARRHSSGSKCATVGIKDGAGAEAPAPRRRHTWSVDFIRSLFMPSSMDLISATSLSISFKILSGNTVDVNA
jgi:hypothetical protein